MSNSKIKLSDILRDRKQSDNSFNSEYKRTELTLEDLEKKLSNKSPVTPTDVKSRASDSQKDAKLDNILSRLSKIKQSSRPKKSNRSVTREVPESEYLTYDFLPSKLQVPRSIKSFLGQFNPQVVENVGKLFGMYETLNKENI